MTYVSFETPQLLTTGDEPALFLIDMALRATAIILAAIALSIALRRASAATRHLLWGASLLGLLALPVLAYALPNLRVAVLPESFSISKDISTAPKSETISRPLPEPIETRAAIKNERESAARLAAPIEKPGRADSDKAALTAQPLEATEAAAPVPTRTFHWSQWILMIWLAGFVVSIGRLVIGIATLWRLSRKAKEITDANWTGLACDIRRQLSLHRRVALLKSARIAMPQTWGTLRPAILLPSDADDWSMERRRVVLMHELAHVKRKDCLTQVMAQIACSFYWFNPLVWMAARRLRIERELACDDQVLEKGTRASDYADLLLDIARTLHSGRCSSLTAVAMARQSQLEGRLLAILNPSLNRTGLNRIKTSLLVFALALVILPLASLRPTAQAKDSQRAEIISLGPGNASGKQSHAKFDNQISNASGLTTRVETEGPLDESTGDPVAEETAEQEQLEAENPAQQEQSSADQPPSSAVQALIDALKDPDPEVREQALNALAQVGGSAAVEALKQAITSDDWRVRKQAAWGLGLRGGQGSTDLLIAALRDQHPDVREQAAWALGLKGGRSAVEPLIAALKDQDERVRSQAAWALGMKGDNSAVAGLIAALRDSSAQVRSQAAWALGMKGNDESVDGLIVALKDASAQVRTQAAWALGMKGAQRAIEPLNAAMKDENRQVRQNAAWALGMLLMKNRGLKINVTLDNKIKLDSKMNLDPNEIEDEPDNIDVDPESDPDPNPNPKPKRQRRRGQNDGNLKDK
ncbi:MAG TPA: M56 family metallopeptidase [Blastocatellia bacterium]|nr:M56 family metallopeptidase [Blastocatellia bacterium]